MNYSFTTICGQSGIFAIGRIVDLEIMVDTPYFDTSLEAATAVVEALLKAERTYYADNAPNPAE